MEIEIQRKYKDVVIDCIALHEMFDEDIADKLLNYDEEIVTGGGFYILFDNYLETVTKKYYNNNGNNSIKLGELLNLVYDEYCEYDEEGKIMHHCFDELIVEAINYNKSSITFEFCIGS